jgi:hypothetical protein
VCNGIERGRKKVKWEEGEESIPPTTPFAVHPRKVSALAGP